MFLTKSYKIKKKCSFLLIAKLAYKRIKTCTSQMLVASANDSSMNGICNTYCTVFRRYTDLDAKNL